MTTSKAIQAIVDNENCPLYDQGMEARAEEAQEFLNELSEELRKAARRVIEKKVEAYNQPMESCNGYSAAEMNSMFL